MTRDAAIRIVLRAAAITIALAALIDPAVTSSRRTRPIVSVVGEDSALADRVEHALERSFVVVRGEAVGVDATVIAGSAVPATVVNEPVFAILNDRSGATVRLDDVRAPAWTPVDARAQVVVQARVTGARGRKIDVALRSDGLIVDRVSREVISDDERVSIPLSFLPTATGAAHLAASIALEGSRKPASADLLIDVRAQRWSVLVFDPRPSWMSTFVRRALERDSRFVITSRIVTSRDVSTDAGTPPHLNDLATLGAFDAVVVGAPEALSAEDVAGLDAFLRRRGGSVVLLFDRKASGPYERLTRVARWVADSSGKATSIALAGADSSALRAAETAWPARLVDGAEPVALANSNRPVVWRAPVGAGQLIVSGAFDSWRFREASTSGFDHFWRTVVADAANAALPPIDVRIANAVLEPGSETDVMISFRDITLSMAQNRRASVIVKLESEQSNGPAGTVRLWPDGTPGEFRGRLRAPAIGPYRLVVASGGSRVSTPIMVSSEARHPSSGDEDLLKAWATSHGGRALSVSQIGELSGALTKAINVPPRLETWHPMRSAWWIVPFALALSGEWWLRRRRGLS